MYEFDSIFICFGDPKYCTYVQDFIDLIPDAEAVGKVLDEHYGWIIKHEMIPRYYFYDEEMGLFARLDIYLMSGNLVLYTPEEFVSDALLSVRKIDLSAFEFNAEGVFNADWEDFEHLFDGNIALVRGGEFITGYIFDPQHTWWFGDLPHNGYIPLKQGGRMGILDKDGNTVLPFMFEDVVIINEGLAFARVDGKFGVVEING
jgi:hypothetical protein